MEKPRTHNEWVISWTDPRTKEDYSRSGLSFFEVKSLEYHCRKDGMKDVEVRE